MICISIKWIIIYLKMSYTKTSFMKYNFSVLSLLKNYIPLINLLFILIEESGELHEFYFIRFCIISSSIRSIWLFVIERNCGQISTIIKKKTREVSYVVILLVIFSYRIHYFISLIPASKFNSSHNLLVRNYEGHILLEYALGDEVRFLCTRIIWSHEFDKSKSVMNNAVLDCLWCYPVHIGRV